MKAVFSGYLSFGLVNIPIKLYNVQEPKMLKFRILHKKCKTPLQYKKYCPSCKEEVVKEDIVKGIEISKGKFFILTEEELKKLRPKGSDAIQIIEFLDKGLIDPIYFDKKYYILPSKEDDKAYWLFKEVLNVTAKIALAKFIFHEKEYLCFIESYKAGLLLTTLYYDYEIRKLKDVFRPAKIKLTSKEMELAKELINKLYEKEFDISKFKDEFAEKLKAAIKKGIKLEVPVVKKKRKENLIEALKASLK